MVRFIEQNDVKSILELAKDYYHKDNNLVANYFRFIRRQVACVSIDDCGQVVGFILLCQAVFLGDSAKQCNCWFVFREYSKESTTKELHSFCRTNIAEPIIYVPLRFSDVEGSVYTSFANRKLCVLEKKEHVSAKFPFSSVSAKQLVTIRKKVLRKNCLLWGVDVAQLLVECYKQNNVQPYLIGVGESRSLIICKKENEILTVYELLSEKNITEQLHKIADEMMEYFGVQKLMIYLPSSVQTDASMRQYAFVNSDKVSFSTDNYVFIE